MEKQRKYHSDAFKLKVIGEVLNGTYSKEVARKKYGIRGKSAILKWMRYFGVSEQTDPGDYLTRMKEDLNSDAEALKKRIRELERALEDAQIKSEVYSRMIDIAERELKIKIRKKPSTKQSGK